MNGGVAVVVEYDLKDNIAILNSLMQAHEALRDDSELGPLMDKVVDILLARSRQKFYKKERKMSL
jgi:hypothetical protein